LLEPVARDVTWRVDLDLAQVEEVRALGGSEAAVPELLPGRNLTTLYEFTPRDSAKALAQGLGEVQVDYFAAHGAQPARLRQPVMATNGEWSRTTPGFRFAVAMAELGRILQGGPAAALAPLERLEAWVRENLPDDQGGYRRDLLDTITLARQIAAKKHEGSRGSGQTVSRDHRSGLFVCQRRALPHGSRGPATPSYELVLRCRRTKKRPVWAG
jgi:hypothetical protein